MSSVGVIMRNTVTFGSISVQQTSIVFQNFRLRQFKAVIAAAPSETVEQLTGLICLFIIRGV